MFRKVVTTFLFLLWAAPGIADVDTAWVRRYNGPGNDYDEACAIAIDDLGNVYVTGGSKDSVTTIDYLTIRYDPNGDTVWTRRYNGPRSIGDQARSIAVDACGNVYVTGASESDYAVIKYHPDGDTAWTRRYDGVCGIIDSFCTDSVYSASEYSCAIAVDDYGNVSVTGESYFLNIDYATLKFDSDGDTAWVRRYDGGVRKSDWAVDIAADDSGNVYVTGTSDGGNQTYGDMTTVKYLPNGDTAWVRRYNGPANHWDYAKAMTIDDWGNVYVTGAIGLKWYTEYGTVKYYANGDTAWTRIFRGPADYWDKPHDIAVDSIGNVYVTGYYYDYFGTYMDYGTVKYDSDGAQLWLRRYDGTASYHDWAVALAVDDRCNVYVVGNSHGDGTDHDIVTIKYDTHGNELWVQRYNGPADTADYASAIAVDDSGNVYVCGYSVGCGTGFDYVTIKYVQTPVQVTDETRDDEQPSEFTLSQSYPNPFNQTTRIQFKLANSGHVALTLHDVLGRKVRTIVSEYLSAGNKSVFWDGKNDSGKGVASGVYFYRIQVGNFSDTKKLVLLK